MVQGPTKEYTLGGVYVKLHQCVNARLLRIQANLYIYSCLPGHQLNILEGPFESKDTRMTIYSSSSTVDYMHSVGHMLEIVFKLIFLYQSL